MFTKGLDMGSFITIDKKGGITEGMDLMKMATVFQKIADKNPDATLNMSDTFLLFSKDCGPIKLSISTKNNIEIIPLDPKKDEVFVIEKGSLVHISLTGEQFQYPKLYTINVFESGESNISIGIVDAPAVLLHENPDVLAAQQWFRNGQVGASSLAMVQQLVLKPNNVLHLAKRESVSIPRDTADFSRCVLMLDAIPSLWNRVQEMSELNDEWKNLLDNSAGQSKWDSGVEKARKYLENPPAEAVSNKGRYAVKSAKHSI